MSKHTDFFRKLPKYFARCLDVIPEHLSYLDNNRMLLLYFGLSGLDVIDELDNYLQLNGNKAKIIDWIYEMQILPTDDFADYCGFRGSSFSKVANAINPYDASHITMTFTALNCLHILGDDLSRINRPAIFAGVKALQQPSGCFRASFVSGEEDLRFLYSACTVCYLLGGDFSAIDVEKAVEFLRQCQTYDGAYGQHPGSESHGGSVFLAVASLTLLGRLDEELPKEKKRRLIRWCVSRQDEAFHGRINKPDDTCYAFWIGASLKMLKAEHLVDIDSIFDYILRAQDAFTGGISKHADTSSTDLLHTYLPLAGLGCLLPSLVKGNEKERGWTEKICPVNAALNLSERAHLFVHKKFQS